MKNRTQNTHLFVRILLTLLLFILVIPVFGQNAERDSRVELIRSRAESDEELLKLEALQLVDRMIREGSVDMNDPELMGLIVQLGLEAFTSPQRSGISPNLVNDHPIVRNKAAVTLGKIGGPYAINGLVEMVHYEEDRDILINVMYALGNIAANPQDEVTTAIGRRISRVSAVNGINNELAFATLYAIEQISLEVGRIDDPSIYQTLIVLSNDRFSRLVTSKASDVLNLLWEQDDAGGRGIQNSPLIPDDPEDNTEDDSSI